MSRRLRRRDYGVDAASLAQTLLGATLVRVLDGSHRLSGRIVETEAYVGVEDRASHAYGGRRTERNESMYASPGTSYVYFTYGMHFCFNVVCGAKDEPVAVLVRAVEPVEGIDTMMSLRAGKRRTMDVDDLCSGPAKLCQAFAIDRALDAEDLVESDRLFILAAGAHAPAPRQVARGSRIGLGEVGKWGKSPLRWWIKGNPHVSR